MGTASVNILVLHFKQNVSHFTPKHIFRPATVSSSRVMNLPPRDLFSNPSVEMDIYCTLFQTVNVRLSAIYFSTNESSNTFISMLGYSKICRQKLKIT